jgi:hypothetical protein
VLCPYYCRRSFRCTHCYRHRLSPPLLQIAFVMPWLCFSALPVTMLPDHFYWMVSFNSNVYCLGHTTYGHSTPHSAHIPLFLYPFLNTTSKTRAFEYLRLTSLGVIGALVKVWVGAMIVLQSLVLLLLIQTPKTMIEWQSGCDQLPFVNWNYPTLLKDHEERKRVV